MTSPKPVAITGKCKSRMIQVQERFTWFPCHTGQELSGESALSFILMTSYCLCLMLLTKNPSHKPYRSPLTPMAPPEISIVSMSPKKYNQKGRGAIVICCPWIPAISAFNLLTFSLFLRLCSQRQSHQKCLSPSLKPEQTLPRVCNAWGDFLYASVTLHLQPSWSPSRKTCCFVFIHLLSQKKISTETCSRNV